MMASSSFNNLTLLESHIREQENHVSIMKQLINDCKKQSLAQELHQAHHGQERNPLKELVENSFECAICLNVMIDPISLSCGHMFCLYCTRGWEMTARRDGRPFKCPKCRRDVFGLCPNFDVKSFIDGSYNIMLSQIDQQDRNDLINGRLAQYQNQVNTLGGYGFLVHFPPQIGQVGGVAVVDGAIRGGVIQAGAMSQGVIGGIARAGAVGAIGEDARAVGVIGEDPRAVEVIGEDPRAVGAIGEDALGGQAVGGQGQAVQEGQAEGPIIGAVGRAVGPIGGGAADVDGDDDEDTEDFDHFGSSDDESGYLPPLDEPESSN